MSAITKGIRKKKQKSGYSDPNISKPIPNLLKRKPKKQRKKRRVPPLTKQWAVKKGGRIPLDIDSIGLELHKKKINKLDISRSSKGKHKGRKGTYKTKTSKHGGKVVDNSGQKYIQSLYKGGKIKY
jgi:hypothetical protein